MNYRFFLLFLSAFVGGMYGLQAQYGLQVGQLSNRGWSQTYNPANLSQQEFEKFQYTGLGTGWIGNNQVTLGGILSDGNTINEASKDQIMGQVEDGFTLSAGYRLDLAQVNIKLGGKTWGFYLSDYLGANANINSPNTIGLILRGNGPYAGQTVSDENSTASFYQARGLGAATSFAFGEKVNLGVRVNLLQGMRMFQLDNAEYTLFTAANGTEIDLDANYSFSSTPDFGNTGLFAFNGFGASVDLGLLVDLNEKMQLEAAVNDLGTISFTTDTKSRVVKLEDFSGIFIDNILQDSVGQLVENQADSLVNLVLPDSARGNTSLMMPMSLRLGFRYQLSEKGQLAATVVYNPLKVGAYTPTPVINVAYQHEVVTGLRLGVNAYYGGICGYGFGAMGTYRIQAGTTGIDLLAGSDNLMGFLVPNSARGMNLFAGVGVAF